MKNTSKPKTLREVFDKGNTSESKFNSLLGGDLLFFNKDEGTEGEFNTRLSSLEHDEDCVCLDCESVRDAL